MKNQPEPSLYELDESQLIYLVTQSGLKPKSGSPLVHCLQQPPAEGVSIANTPPADAIQCLTQPERVFAVTSWPPQEASVHWYYGRNDQPYLVQHEVMNDGRHLMVWPIRYAAVAEVLSIPLEGNESEMAAGDFTVSTNRDGMLLFAAICDALQEQALDGLMRRATTKDASLSFDDLSQAVERTLTVDDLRWTAARLSRLCPVPLRLSEESLQSTINQFTQERLMSVESEGYWPTSLVAAACLRWNAGDAFAAVTERNKGIDGKWDWSHYAFLHAAGGMFAFEFTDISASGFEVSIKEADSLEIQEKIVSLVSHEVLTTPNATSESAELIDRCGSCGAELPPGVKFCTQCGVKL